MAVYSIRPLYVFPAVVSIMRISGFHYCIAIIYQPEEIWKISGRLINH